MMDKQNAIGSGFAAVDAVDVETGDGSGAGGLAGHAGSAVLVYYRHNDNSRTVIHGLFIWPYFNTVQTELDPPVDETWHFIA